MNIKPMLARFQTTIGRHDLIEQMVLRSEGKRPFVEKGKSAKSINIIVGYNSSPQSHTALDIALCIAHQTRLATKREVIIQAVYVVENYENSLFLDVFDSEIYQPILQCPVRNLPNSAIPVLTQPKLRTKTTIKQAEAILWQARSLAEEWQGYFKAHLRFGSVGEELKKVVESEVADILFLGCESPNHPIISTLGSNFPCTVVGIPHCIEEQHYSLN